MMKIANLTALVFTLSLSLAAIQPTSVMALGLTDILEAGKGHLKDLGDRWNHDDEHVEGDSLYSGTFRDDDIGRDGVHYVDGTVSIVRAESGSDEFYIQLNRDFKAGLAPDLYLYVADRKVVNERSFDKATTLEVSKLKSGSGAQYYKLSSEDIWNTLGETDHLEIVIWCKRFHQYMGAATLTESE